MNPEFSLFRGDRFRVVRVKHVCEDGMEHERAIVRHPGAVTILPMVDLEHVCLIRNFRMSVNETLIELPAGTLEANEDPGQTARRELTEETGYRADGWEKLHEFYLSPGILDERMHLYLATQLRPGEPRRERGEQIENWVVSWDAAMDMVLRGEIQDAKTMVGLMMYDRLRGRS